MQNGNFLGHKKFCYTQKPPKSSKDLSQHILEFSDRERDSTVAKLEDVLERSRKM